MVARGVFEIPQATDNSQEELFVVKDPPDIDSPYDFREDTLVSYTFYDAAGNSVSCSFYVNVIGKSALKTTVAVLVVGVV